MNESDKPQEGSKGSLSDRQVYNLVTDTAIGPNIRVKDNVIQAVAIAGCVVLGCVIGALVVDERLAGACVGGFVGLVAGALLSGFVLMIYRAVKHIQGKHD